MFEKILEKIIISYFGKYINGIDKNNVHLGVFKGNVKIENVSLKPEVMDLLDLPIDIVFSNIGRMTLNIPWSKLSSSPVPITLEDIYLVIGPRKESDWSFVDKSSIQSKLESIESYAKDCLRKLAKKKDNEEAGYMEKMAVKIIDNIQLEFKNIHLRWEDKPKGFSFGITLTQLIANTTDDQWKQTFIDRTKPEEAAKPMYKLLQLTGLRVYWNESETEFLSQAQKYNVFSKMQSLIEQPLKHKGVELVIDINADFKLVNTQVEVFDSPLYELTIQLDWIDLHLKHMQLQQISDLFNLSIKYRNALWAARKENVQINEEMREFYKKHFMNLFGLKLRSKDNKNPLDASQQQIFETVLRSVDYNTLYQWVRRVVKQQTRETRVNELLSRGKGLFYSSSSEDTTITLEQMQEIERVIEEQLENSKKDAVQRPPESIRFSTTFLLRGGSVLLSRQRNNNLEGIKLVYTDLQLYLNSTEDMNLEIFIKLKEIGANLQDGLIVNPNSLPMQSINVLYRSPQSLPISQNSSASAYVMKFIYKRFSPTQRAKSQQGLDGSISCFVEPLECRYNAKFLERFRDFFDIHSQHEFFAEMQKNQREAKEQVAQGAKLGNQNSNQGKPKERMLSGFRMGLDVRLGSQTVIVPFEEENHDNQQKQQQYWAFKLGEIRVKLEELPRDIYNVFTVAINNLSIEFVQQIQQKKQLELPEGEQQQQQAEGQAIPSIQQINRRSIVKDYSINIEMLSQRRSHALDFTQPLTQVIGKLPPLTLQFDQQILCNALKLPQIMSPARTNAVEQLRLRNEQLQKEAQLVCQIKYREKLYSKYSHVLMIIDSSNKAHFFVKDKTLHLQPFLQVHLAHLADYTMITNAGLAQEEQINRDNIKEFIKSEKVIELVEEQKVEEQKKVVESDSNKDKDNQQQGSGESSVKNDPAVGAEEIKQTEEVKVEESNKEQTHLSEQQSQQPQLAGKEEAQTTGLSDDTPTPREYSVSVTQPPKNENNFVEVHFEEKMFYAKFEQVSDFEKFEEITGKVREQVEVKREMLKAEQDEDEELQSIINAENNNNNDNVNNNEGSLNNTTTANTSQENAAIPIEKQQQSATSSQPASQQQLPSSAPSMTDLDLLLESQVDMQFESISVLYGQSSKDEEKPLLQFQLLGTSFHRAIDSQFVTTSLSFDGITVIDSIYTYNHPLFQPIFAPSKKSSNEKLPEQQEINMLSSKVTDKFVAISLKENQKSDAIHIKTEIGSGVLNWKPDSLLALRSFIKTFVQSKGGDYEDGQQTFPGSNTELEHTDIFTVIKQILADSSFNKFKNSFEAPGCSSNEEQEQQYDISEMTDYLKCLSNKYCQSSLISSSTTLKEMQINVIQHQTHVPLARIQLSDSSFESQHTRQGLFVQGAVHKLQMFDLTNYPNTRNPDENLSDLNEEEQNKKGQQKETLDIIQPKYFDNSSSPLLTFSWSSFEKPLPKTAHCNSFLVVKCLPIQITYTQQPFMRLIDYFNNQILALISYPDQLLQNNNIFGSLDGMVKQCLCPTFLKMRIDLEQPEIIMKALPNEEPFILAFQQVSLENFFQVNNSRFNEKISSSDKEKLNQIPLKDLWTCEHRIDAQDCIIKIQNGEFFRELSLPFRINLLWEQLMFYPEITYLWPALKKSMIRGNKLRGHLSSVLARFTSSEYTRFVRMFLHNFTYDDQKDSLFIFNYQDVVALEPNPIDMVLDISGISVVKSSETTLDPEQILYVQCSRLKWMRDGLRNIKLAVLAQEVIVSVFSKTEECFIRRDIIGDQVEQTKNYEFQEDFKKTLGIGENILECYTQAELDMIDEEYDGNSYDMAKRVKEMQSKFNESTAKLHFRQSIMKTSGDQDLNIATQHLKMLLQTDTFLELLDWAKPKPSCYPQYLIRDEESRLVVIFSAKNVVAAFPAQLCQQVIALRGNLSLIFVRQRMQSHQILRGKLMEGEMQQKDLGDLFTYNVTLDGLEIFSCDFNELMTVEFSEVSKRSLLCPLTASFKSKYELCIGPKPQQSLYFLARNEGQVQNLKLKFSFNNLQLLFKTLHQQTVFMKVLDEKKDKLSEEMQVEEKPEEQKKEQQDNNSLAQQQQIYKEKYEIPTNSTFDIEIDEIQVQLINDSNKCSVPLLSLRLNENKFLYNFSGNVKKSLSVSICMQLCYYNAQCSFWEPIIERTQFLVDFVANQYSNPKKYLSIEVGEGAELNMNLSTNMLLSLKESLQTLNTQVEQFIDAIKGQGKDQMGMANDIEDKNNSKITNMWRKSNIQSSNIITSGNDGEDTAEGEMSASAIALNRNSSSKKNKENVEQISPFSIQNNLGYALIVENERGQQYVIGNEQTVNYMIDEEESAEYASINSKTVSLKILSDKCTYPAITDVNLGWLKSRKVLISSEVVNGRISDGAIVLENSVQTTNKLLKIHSPLSIQNSTDQTMIVQISPDQNMNPQNTTQITIQKMSTSYIPFDRTQNVFQFKFNYPDQAFSDLISLAKLCKLEAETSFQLKHGKNKAISTFLQIQKLENETRLVFEPFITVKNCLPMRVYIGLMVENERKDAAEGELNYQEEFQTHMANLTSKVIMQVKVPGFQGSDYLTLSLPLPNQTSQQRNIYYPQEQFIIDYRGQTFALSIKSQIKPFGAKKFFIYSQCLIINSVPNDLYFFCKKKEQILLASGQKVQNIPQTENVNHLGKITLLENNPSIFISCTEKGTKLSRPLNITGIGNDVIDVFTSQGTSNNVIEVSVDVSLQEVDKELKIFSKIIQLTPKYLIVNETEFSIMLRQENASKEVILINPGQRIPLSWTDATKPRNYNVMVTDAANNKAYGWSGTLNMGLSTISFAVRNPAQFSETMHLKATIKSYQHYFFLHFLQLKHNVNPSYTIKNDLKFARLVVYQGCFFNQKNASYKENYYHIDEGCEIDYAQDLPTLANDLIVEIQFYGSREGYVLEALVLDLECPEQQSEIIVGNMNNQNQLVLYMSQGYVGGVKSVVFREQKKVETLENGLDWQVAVNLPAVSLSLIGDVETVTKEIIFLNFKTVEFIFLSTSKDRIYQAKVQQIQVDNNTALSTIYPVALTSSKQQSSVPHFSLVIEEDISVIQLTKIKSLRLAIQHSTLKLTDELISSLLSFFNQFASPLFSQNATEIYTPSNCQSINEGKDNNGIIYPFPWMTAEFPQQKGLVLIQQMELYPIGLNLSYKKIRETAGASSSSSQASSLNILQNALVAVGIAFANVEGASIKLKGIKYQNIIESSDAILKRLLLSYKNSMMQQTLQILGSVSIIGNPVSLFKNIGTGVSDLIEMPMGGFIKGPIEGGVGIVLGAGSLLKNTVSGTFQSVQGITDSIGSGFSQLSMDKEFMRSRDKIKKKKAKHVGQGVKLGLQSLFTGISEGLVGVVSKPIQGAEKGGAFGFLKGVTKGVAGLVFKPITGVIDAASKTAEGIKNTATYFDDKATENRIRPPRVFYCRERYFQDYLIHDCELMSMLQTFKKAKYADYQLVSTNVLEYKGEQFILILTIQALMLYAVKHKQIIFHIPPYEIYSVMHTDKGLIVTTFNVIQELNCNEAELYIDSLPERGSIYKKIQNLIQQSK